MSDPVDDEMKTLLAAAREGLAAGQPVGPPEGELPVRNVDELRAILKKFRRAMGAAGNPGTLEAEAALRAGWIISSGTVDGHGDEIFHVFMLTNGALFYLSGDPTPPIDFTGKWFLGDSIPELESRIPHTVAALMAEHGLDWPDSPTF